MSRSLRDTPRPFQPAITQRHIKTEVAQCVGGVEGPVRGVSRNSCLRRGRWARCARPGRRR
jgi:hypothetical protein